MVDGFTICDGNGVGLLAGIQDWTSSVQIANNTITDNRGAGISTGEGAWIYAASITNNVITENRGDGFFCRVSHLTFKGNIISRNGGDGVDASYWPNSKVIGNTITANVGDGLRLRSGTVTLVNNIVAFNGDCGVRKSTTDNVAGFSHNDVFGNTDGDYLDFTPPAEMGNFSLDPLFVNQATNDFHLLSQSPCIDAGDNSTVASGEKDVDGKPRILGPHVDIGAYEYGVPPFSPTDVKRCLNIACGTCACLPNDLTRLNVDPGSPGVDLHDAIRIARKVAGLEPNP